MERLCLPSPDDPPPGGQKANLDTPPGKEIQTVQVAIDSVWKAV
jgi:hypothetical protein